MSNQTPIAVAAALGVGIAAALLGFAGGWVLHSPETEVVEVTRAPTEAEIAAALEAREADQDELSLAQIRVAELERESAEKERRVNELESKIARGAEVGKALRAELEQVKAELEETKVALAQAEEEKEELLVQLKETTEMLEQTEEELAVTKVQRDNAREDALYNRWQDFLGDAQLEICDKGNRKRLGNCREAVLASLETPERRDAFAHCIRSGQAQPIVAERDKDVEMPEFASMLDEDVRQVKGWYIDLCDPTLPERDDIPLAIDRLPATATAEAPAEPSNEG
jgi:hypothetical protein